jgi:hypothetical protein
MFSVLSLKKKENKKSKTDENNHEPEGCVAGA